MKNEKLRVPKLRFKEFSGEWEEKELGSITSQLSYGLTVRPEYIESGIPLISARELKNGLINYDKAPMISQKSYNELSEKAKAKRGDIFLTKTGTIGLSAYVDEDFPIAITQNIAVIRVPNENYNHQFILQTFKTKSFYKIAISKVNQSTIMDLQLQDIRKLSISFPQKQEQEKIASFLSSIDKKINQLSKKDELLQNYKKSMMQKIFSQKLRFKKADESDYPKWEEFRLKEVLDYEQPTKYIVKSTEYCDSYDIPVLTAGKTFILGYTNEKEGIYSKSPVIIFDDFTTANHYVDFDFKIKSSAMKLLKEKNKNINLKFVYEFIQRLHFPLGEHKRYWISEYAYLKIKLPCLEEQTKIANFLSSLDTKISQNRKALEETQKFKKALLQKMFV